MAIKMTDAQKGVSLAILSALFYSLISVCVKWIGGALPTMEIVFFRALVMLLVGALWLTHIMSYLCRAYQMDHGKKRC